MRALLGLLLFIVWFQIQIQEAFFQEDFELVLNHLRVFLLFGLLEMQLKVNSFDLLNSSHWNSHQWSVTTCHGIASASVVFECFLSHLNPSVNECRVVSSLVLQQLSLEEHWIIRIVQINLFINWWQLNLLLDSRSSTGADITFQTHIDVFHNWLCCNIRLQSSTINSHNGTIAAALLQVIGA